MRRSINRKNGCGINLGTKVHVNWSLHHWHPSKLFIEFRPLSPPKYLLVTIPKIHSCSFCKGTVAIPFLCDRFSISGLRNFIKFILFVKLISSGIFIFSLTKSSSVYWLQNDAFFNNLLGWSTWFLGPLPILGVTFITGINSDGPVVNFPFWDVTGWSFWPSTFSFESRGFPPIVAPSLEGLPGGSPLSPNFSLGGPCFYPGWWRWLGNRGGPRVPITGVKKRGELEISGE